MLPVQHGAFALNRWDGPTLTLYGVWNGLIGMGIWMEMVSRNIKPFRAKVITIWVGKTPGMPSYIQTAPRWSSPLAFANSRVMSMTQNSEWQKCSSTLVNARPQNNCALKPQN